jgi:5'-3' exonuclease
VDGAANVGGGGKNGAVGSRLMLLDAASLYFRAYFGVPETTTAPDGTPVNAVRGFIDMVAFLVGREQPTNLVACMDADWRPAFRVAAVPSYKTHRLAPDGTLEIVPDTLVPQIPIIEAVLAAVGIAAVGSPGYEADDVLGTLAAHSTVPTDVVTGDRDLFQVVDDARDVRVLYTGRGMRNLEVVDEAFIEKKYGIPGRAYADFATLRGDPSDGLPGVAGIGDRTAASLIAGYGSIEGLLAALDDPQSGLAPGIRRKLTDARDYLVVAPSVVRVATDAPLPAYEDMRPAAPADAEALVELADRWNLDSPLNRLLAALSR